MYQHSRRVTHHSRRTAAGANSPVVWHNGPHLLKSKQCQTVLTMWVEAPTVTFFGYGKNCDFSSCCNTLSNWKRMWSWHNNKSLRSYKCLILFGFTVVCFCQTPNNSWLVQWQTLQLTLKTRLIWRISISIWAFGRKRNWQIVGKYQQETHFCSRSSTVDWSVCLDASLPIAKKTKK